MCFLFSVHLMACFVLRMLSVVFVFWCTGALSALDVDCCVFFGVLCAFNVISIDDDVFW